MQRWKQIGKFGGGSFKRFQGLYFIFKILLMIITVEKIKKYFYIDCISNLKYKLIALMFYSNI